MPIYEYECNKCGNQFEELQDMDDPPPECKCGGHCKRMVSQTSFVLKGEGWFRSVDRKRNSVKRDPYDLVDSKGDPL